nr:MAG TPA: hypothetical protein [Corticoviridae sp.]
MAGKQIAIAGASCYLLGAIATAVLLSRGDTDSLSMAMRTTVISSCGFYIGAVGLGLWALGK